MRQARPSQREIPTGPGVRQFAQTDFALVNIACNSNACKERLKTALSTPNTTIYVENDVVLDLSNENRIPIAAGVTLAGRRDARNVGPLLHTTTRPEYLFEITGDDVHITGLRIRGPELGHAHGDDNTPRGVLSNSYVNIEIDNNELYGWSGAAIEVQDYDDRIGIFGEPIRSGDVISRPLQIAKARAVHIHDNFIHHNQHEEKFGYGVVVGHGAYAHIARNVFDFNRHAIAADGREGTGYVAHENLVLKGGGIDDCKIWGCSDTHQFDMHGRKTCGEIFGIKFQGEYNCGPAGEYMDIRYNAFQYTKDAAFRLRGTPAIGAEVNENVFAHNSVDAAVEGLEPGRNNIADVDTFGEYGVCDFDGDGYDDLFLATGKTWWYSSAGRMHWVYLKKADERLHQVALGDFDGDNRCDVFTTSGNQWLISRRGTSEWVPIGANPVSPNSSGLVPFEQLRFGDFNGDGRMDVFMSSNGQWFFAAPGIHGWQPLEFSGIPVQQLRFGNFNDDRITDVFSLANGQWSVSLGGRTKWQHLNARLSTDLKNLVIIDVDGNGRDDILINDWRGHWKVSWDGRSEWKTLFEVNDLRFYEVNKLQLNPRTFWGRFNAQSGADGLILDNERRGHLVSGTRGVLGALVPYSLFPY
jgi:hypothetical protein